MMETTRDRKPVQVLVSLEERGLLEQGAREAHLPLSTWIRLVCLDAIRQGKRVSVG